MVEPCCNFVVVYGNCYIDYMETVHENQPLEG